MAVRAIAKGGNMSVTIRLAEPLPGLDAANRRKNDPTGVAGTTLEHYAVRERIWFLLSNAPDGMTWDRITAQTRAPDETVGEVLTQEVARGAARIVSGEDGEMEAVYVMVPVDQRVRQEVIGAGPRDITTEILSALGDGADAGRALTLKELSAATGVRGDHLSERYLPKLIKAGLVVQEKEGSRGRGNAGTYTLAPDEPETDE
jgi:hypothetical protein